MTEVDNQDAAGADVCKIVGLAFRCERKAADRILEDLKQLRGGAGTPAAFQPHELRDSIEPSSEARNTVPARDRNSYPLLQMLSTGYPA